MGITGIYWGSMNKEDLFWCKTTSLSLSEDLLAAESNNNNNNNNNNNKSLPPTKKKKRRIKVIVVYHWHKCSRKKNERTDNPL